MLPLFDWLRPPWYSNCRQNRAIGVTMARLYIGNLPHVTTEHELQAWVEQYGFKVESVQVIRDLETGASQGFAFVELPEVLRAHEAVEALNGQKMEGTTSESAKQDHSHLGAKAARPAGLDYPR